MLNGDRLIELIGHATINSPLDEFLTDNGIKSRPKGKSGHYDIEEKSAGIYFQYYEYDDYLKKYFIPVKSKGMFVLQGVIFRNKAIDKGGAIFSGRYPFGAKNNFTPDDVIEKFGRPRKFDEGDKEFPDTYHYSLGSMVFNFDFNHQSRILECLQVQSANEFSRKHGLID